MIQRYAAKGSIAQGSILIERNTLLPEPLRFEAGEAESGWGRVENGLDRHQMELRLAEAGWTSFYMAGAIRTRVFGFKPQAMIQAALNRLMSAARLKNCNCIEIDKIAVHSFFGMPYVSMSAHSSHIQAGLGLIWQ